MKNGFILLEMQELKIFPLLGLIMDPLCYTLIKKNIDIKTKTFRYEEFFFHIPGFSDVIKEAWNTLFVGSNVFQLVKKNSNF